MTTSIKPFCKAVSMPCESAVPHFGTAREQIRPICNQDLSQGTNKSKEQESHLSTPLRGS